MSETSESYVFISYSRRNKEIVQRVRDSLADNNVAYWMDREGIPEGASNWEHAIRKAVRGANSVLYFMSPDALKSNVVQGELALAEMHNLTIYPVWIVGDNLIECAPLKMAKAQYIDMRGSRYMEGLDRLVKMLSPEATEEKEEVAFVPQKVQPLPEGKEPRNPYKGLNAFQEDDAQDFFGRERLIHELIRIMGNTIESGYDRMMAVIGPSGSGKSSAVMAGLIPTLKDSEKGIAGSHNWIYLDPFTPGSDPMEELSHVLKSANPPNYRSIRKELESEDCMGLVRIAEDLLKADDQKVFVYIDQFEELFTLVDEEREREHFINTIVAAATEPESPVVIVLTLRADFYDRPMNYNLLGELIQSNNRSVLPLTLGELNDAITLPAQLDDVQLEFEEDLVAEIAFDLLEFRDPADKTTSLAGALPLLQFALQRLYSLRDGNQLTMTAYTEMGRVSGAIGSHAEDEFNKLSEIEDAVLHRVFYHLVNIDEFGAPTRRRSKRPEVTQSNPAAERLVESLVSNRLLVAGKDEMLEVAHEALLRSWDRLHDWIEYNGRHIQWLQKVQYEASDWQQQEKPDRLLWDYEELQPVYEAIDHLKITLDPVTSEFVRPQTERLLDDFETTPEYRQLSIIDRWREIGEDAAPALVGALAYAKGDIVLESIDRALWQIPHAAEKALMDAMSSGDPNVREAVADAAGRLGVVNTVRGLLDNIKADSRAYCLAEIKAITALAASAKTNRDTVPALLAVLKDHEKRTVDERQAAAEALGFVIDKSDRQAVEALVTCMDGKHADKNWEVREAVVMALGQIGKKDSGLIGVLIRKTREKGEAFHVQRAAIDTLGQLRQRKAMNVLINAAVDNRDDIRHAAVRALAVLETEDVLSMLMYRLKDESPKVRKATAEALGAFGHAHAWRPLVDALETEKVSSVRVAIVEALECYPDKYDVARALRRAIQDDTASVRAAAAHALSEMNKDQHGRNIKALLEGFKDRDTDVKLAVIRALGHLQTNQATQTMFNTLRGNRTWRIRFEGAVALAAIRDDSIEDDLRKILEGKDSDAAFAAAVVLAGLGDDSPRVKKELLGVLEDPRLEARCIAAGALGKLKDSETLQQLLGELTNQNPMVREAIAEAIRAVNDGSATPDLRDLLNYPFQGVREAANTAIGY